MKPLMLVPPAQAEALYDAQLGSARQVPEGLRLENRSLDRLARLPWADDDSAEETGHSEKPPTRLAAKKRAI